MDDPVAPITVLVVDDHPAVRAGVVALIDAEPGLMPVGAVGEAHAVAPAVYTRAPDVVVLDHQLADGDGLSLCRELTRALLPPAVLIYSAFASRDMIVPAHIAGARALVDKVSAPRELADAVRHVAAGDDLLPRADPDALSAAGHRLPEEDLPLLGMLINHLPVGEVAQALGVEVAEADARIDAVLARLIVASRTG